MTDVNAGTPAAGGGGGGARATVSNVAMPVTDQTKLGDPFEKPRRIIAYHLIWLLIGIITASGAIMLVGLYRCSGTNEAEIVFRWMGLALGPVGALVGSAVTFYMERPRR